MFCLVTASPFSGLRAVQLTVRVKSFLHVALVCGSRQGGMDRHRHGGRGCHHGNWPPIQAVLHQHGRAAVALPFSPLWLRPSAVLQMVRTLRGPSRDMSSVPGEVVVWRCLEPLGVVLLLRLAFIPVYNLRSKGQILESACCVVSEGFHHLREIK